MNDETVVTNAKLTKGKGVGQGLGGLGYRRIDSDTHVNEPPDLWTSRVAQKFKDRVPHMKSFDQGDAWVMEGVAEPINFGKNAAAGLPVEEQRPWVRWDEIRPGGWNPKARLDEMDMDLVDAAILYPTPRISQLVVGTKDPSLHLAMVQAYNDWLAEYCSHDPNRLGGILLMPNRGIEQAVREVKRVAECPGIVGALIGCYPHGDVGLSEEDDAAWRAVVEAGIPLHIHVGLSNDLPTDVYSPATISQTLAMASFRFLESPMRIMEFLNGRVFERIPELTVVLAEVDAGWVPYVKEQVDNRVLRRSPGSDLRRRELPSTVIERHFYYTYITDHFAVRNRHAVGVERMMWSSDFPHSGSDWPHSVRVIHADFADVPAVERDQILAGNAQRLYRFGS